MRVVFATVVCTFAIGCFAGDVLFLDFFGPLIVLPLALLSFAIVGSLLVVRRAGGPIGWLLAIAGALFQPLLLSGAYAYAGLEGGRALPGAELAVWLGTVIWIPAIGLLVIAMVLFPDGRPPGRVFAILLWAFVGAIVAGAVAYALADRPIVMPRPFTDLDTGAPSRSIPNPFALHGPIGDLMVSASVAFDRILLSMFIAPAALVVRFVRSRGVERQQLKWLMYTAALGFGLLVFAFLAPAGTIADLAWAASVMVMGLLPVAIGIAITRYRLYDIDVLINRTLVYGLTTGGIAVAFFGGIVVLQTVLRPFTSGSEIVVAASTLLTVALFQPFRSRVQRAVDRRFSRSRYDAARTLDAFAEELRDEVDLDAVRVHLLDAVAQTMSPAHASVWLRGRVP